MTDGMAEYWAIQAAQQELGNAIERGRPFILLRPRMFRDGNQWCAMYGDDLQSGVAGFGASPDAASRAFDRAWVQEVS